MRHARPDGKSCDNVCCQTRLALIKRMVRSLLVKRLLWRSTYCSICCSSNGCFGDEHPHLRRRSPPSAIPIIDSPSNIGAPLCHRSTTTLSRWKPLLVHLVTATSTTEWGRRSSPETLTALYHLSFSDDITGEDIIAIAPSITTTVAFFG